ncbi:MAG: ROK family protein [Myxococcota bacterium]
MAIGVDIGGSGVRGARVGPDGLQSAVVSRPLSARTVSAVLDAVASVHLELGGGLVGVGVPGFVRDGVVLGSPNLPDLAGVDLRAALQERLEAPCAVANDANVAALGIWHQRGGTEDVVLLTLGTGVGGGIITGGQLLQGSGGTGAEIGHVVVGGTRACGCGGRGCLETWCSNVGLLSAAAEQGHVVTSGEQVVLAADDGQAWAVEILNEAAQHLGFGLVTLVNLFNPDAVVMLGGLAAARTWWEPAVQWMSDNAVPPSAKRVRVVWGGRADEAAILGAGILAGRIEHR